MQGRRVSDPLRSKLCSWRDCRLLTSLYLGIRLSGLCRKAQIHLDKAVIQPPLQELCSGCRPDACRPISESELGSTPPTMRRWQCRAMYTWIATVTRAQEVRSHRLMLRCQAGQQRDSRQTNGKRRQALSWVLYLLTVHRRLLCRLGAHVRIAALAARREHIQSHECKQ